jgi:hypothetical protein
MSLKERQGFVSFNGDNAVSATNTVYQNAIDGERLSGVEFDAQLPSTNGYRINDGLSRDIMRKSVGNNQSMFQHMVSDSKKWNLMSGYPGRNPQRDDLGISGGGVNATNQPNTYGIDLDPYAYGDSYASFAQMQRLLPIGTICFRYVPAPHVTIGNTGIIHTVTSINRFLATRMDVKDRCYTGEGFDEHWRFAGILIELSTMQDMEAGSKLYKATLCSSGPAKIQNIFCSTGAQFQCGNGLYLVLRRIEGMDGVTSISVSSELVDSNTMALVDVSKYLSQTPIKKKSIQYFQLQAVVSPSGLPPDVNMYNGPDWDGAYYRIGTVHKRDDIDPTPMRNSVYGMCAIHSIPNDNDSWVDAIGRLDPLEILVGTV